MKNLELENSELMSLSFDEMNKVDGGIGFKDLVDGFNALNDSWDGYKADFMAGWNSYK